MLRVSLLALCLLAAGCGEDLPNPAASAWKTLEIEYCLPGGEARILVTQQAETLEQLRAAMTPKQTKALDSILKSNTNELRLTLASGQKWNLYFRDLPTSITFHDPNAPTRSYVADISNELYERLAAALKSAGGPPISLVGGCRIPATRT